MTRSWYLVSVREKDMKHSNADRTAGFSNAEKDQTRTDNETAANSAGIENHRMAAEHFARAAEFHYQAARYHGEGNHLLAHECAVKAIGHSVIACRFQEMDTETHANDRQK